MLWDNNYQKRKEGCVGLDRCGGTQVVLNVLYNYKVPVISYTCTEFHFGGRDARRYRWHQTKTYNRKKITVQSMVYVSSLHEPTILE